MNIARTSKDIEIIIETLPNVPVAPQEFEPVFVENEAQREFLVKEIKDQMEDTTQMMTDLRGNYLIYDIFKTHFIFRYHGGHFQSSSC